MGIAVVTRTLDWNRDGKIGIRWGRDGNGGGAGPKVRVGTGAHGLGQGRWMTRREDRGVMGSRGGGMGTETMAQRAGREPADTAQRPPGAARPMRRWQRRSHQKLRPTKPCPARPPSGSPPLRASLQDWSR